MMVEESDRSYYSTEEHPMMQIRAGVTYKNSENCTTS